MVLARWMVFWVCFWLAAGCLRMGGCLRFRGVVWWGVVSGFCGFGFGAGFLVGWFPGR